MYFIRIERIRKRARIIAEWLSAKMIGVCLNCKIEFKKREKKYRFCSVICSNSYNKNGLKKVILPPHEKELAEFIGIMLGDGYTGKYQASVTLNSIADREYIPYVTSLIKKLFPGITISSVKKIKEKATELKINSSVVSQYLKDMGIIPKQKIIPVWILGNIEYSKACVRGLLDTEGSISFKSYISKKGEVFYKQLNFRNTDRELMKLVRDVLLQIGLSPTMSLKKSLYISNQKDIDILRNKIGFSNPKLIKKSFVQKGYK